MWFAIYIDDMKRPTYALLGALLTLSFAFNVQAQSRFTNFTVEMTKALKFKANESRVGWSESSSLEEQTLIGLYRNPSNESFYFQMEGEPLFRFQKPDVLGEELGEVDIVLFDFGEEMASIQLRLLLYVNFDPTEVACRWDFFDDVPRTKLESSLTIRLGIGSSYRFWAFDAHNVSLKSKEMKSLLVEMDEEFSAEWALCQEQIATYQDENGRLREDLFVQVRDERAKGALANMNHFDLADAPVSVLGDGVDLEQATLNVCTFLKCDEDEVKSIRNQNYQLKFLMNRFVQLQETTEPEGNETVESFILRAAGAEVDKLYGM